MSIHSEILASRFFKGRNFMTPDVIRYGKITPNIAYELSVGDGIKRGTKMYGVTVMVQRPDGQIKRTSEGVSTCFSSLDEAEQHITKLACLEKGLQHVANRERYVLETLDTVKDTGDWYEFSSEDGEHTFAISYDGRICN